MHSFFLINIVFNFGVLIVEGILLEDQQISSHFSIPILTQNNIFFPLIGYYIENVMDKNYCTSKNRVISILISILSICLICLIVSNSSCSDDLSIDIIKYDKFFGILICVPAASLYFNMKNIIIPTYNNRKSIIIEQLGSAVFGVYLIEKITRALTSIVFNVTSPYIGNFLASILWVFSAVGLGFIIICCIRNIPCLGKYICKWI